MHMGIPKSLLGKTGEIRFNTADTFKKKNIHDHNTLKKYKRPHSFFLPFFSTLAGVFIMQEETVSSDTTSQEKADCYTTTPTISLLDFAMTRLLLHRSGRVYPNKSKDSSWRLSTS